MGHATSRCRKLKKIDSYVYISLFIYVSMPMEHVGPKSTKQGMSTRPWPGKMLRHELEVHGYCRNSQTHRPFLLEKVVRKEKLKHFNKAARSWSPAGWWRRLLVGCGHDAPGRVGGARVTGLGSPLLKGLKCSLWPVPPRPLQRKEKAKAWAQWRRVQNPPCCVLPVVAAATPATALMLAEDTADCVFRERKGYMVVDAAGCGVGALVRGACGGQAPLSKTGDPGW